MNQVILKGQIRNIQPSHDINGIEYEKAELVTQTDKGECVVKLVFKNTSNPYKEGQEIELVGSLRSRSVLIDETKSKLDVFVQTYFESPTYNDEEIFDKVKIDGTICKINNPFKTQRGVDIYNFILANNIYSDVNNKKFNSYIPCKGIGKIAKQLENCKVGDKLEIEGQISSHIYKKKLGDDQIELTTAYELIVQKVDILA